MTTKAERVHAMVNAGHFPGMSEAFDAHMGAACWTDPAYAPDASMWAAAWKASAAAAEIDFEVLSARLARMNDHAVTLAETARVVEQQRIAALIARHSGLTLETLEYLETMRQGPTADEWADIDRAARA